MKKDKLEQLFLSNKNPVQLNDVTDVLLSDYDNFILSNIDENSLSDEVIFVYEKFSPMKQEAPDSMKFELFSAIRNFANENLLNEKYIEALVLYRFLIVKSVLKVSDYPLISSALLALNNINISKEFIKIYEKKEENIPLKLLECADFYKRIKDYKIAIKYYEKYTQIDETKSSLYTILADLYSKAYSYDSLDKQLECYLKAYALKPDNRLTLHGLAFTYEKLNDYKNAKKFYMKLLDNNPSEIDYYNYGMFLIHNGQIYEGHKYLTHRFNIDDINLKYPTLEPRWDLYSDISDKILLIHYEQGFGDTIMYCRFVPYMKKFAKKIIFVVQDALYSLIKNSPKINDEIEIISDKTDLETVEFDYTMALLDCPYVLRTEIDTIPYSNKYIEASIQTSNSQYFKIGLSYKGDESSNYKGRDLDPEDFKFLSDIPNVKLYLFQKNEIREINWAENLVKNCTNFEQTAKVLQSMNIVISTDNVILNLAGSLGIPTIGLFNYETNFRWFQTKGTDVGWYKTVKPLQAEKQDCWKNVLVKIPKMLNR